MTGGSKVTKDLGFVKNTISLDTKRQDEHCSMNILTADHFINLSKDHVGSHITYYISHITYHISHITNCSIFAAVATGTPSDC